VILSGSAFDGTLGIEAIKNEGGISLAQDNSAKYDSMPRSAIASGCVDLVLAPAQIAKELARISQHPGLIPLHLEDSKGSPNEQNDYQKVLQLLKTSTGTDFALYKSPTLQRRIARRIVLNKLPDLAAYVSHLQKNKEETAALYQDVLINVTSFFRNPEVFEVLKQKVFSKLNQSRTPDQPVRVWVPGCSTGQEAYSIAMAFLEFASRASTQVPLQIFATDVNETLLQRARSGLYFKTQVQNLTPERRRRFFIEEEGGWRICKPIRELCVFARHDLLSDPPFSKVDIVSCRNLLIYLNAQEQKRLMPTFHYGLKPGGFLLLGNSEAVGAHTESFSPQDKTHKLYCRTDVATRLPVKIQKANLHAPKYGAPKVHPTDSGPPDELEAQKEMERLLLIRFSPASGSVLIWFSLRRFHSPKPGLFRVGVFPCLE
jgi:two-component system CheB/CheR fusion protein